MVTGTQSGAGALNCSYLICSKGVDRRKEAQKKRGSKRKESERGRESREGTPGEDRGRAAARVTEKGGTREGGRRGVKRERSSGKSKGQSSQGVLRGHSQAEQLPWPLPGSEDDEEAVPSDAAAAVPSQHQQPVRTSTCAKRF